MTGDRMFGYLRVSTDAQAASGLGLDAQRAAIDAAAHLRGWEIEYVVDEAASGKNLRRPRLNDMLDRLRAGDACGVVVSRPDRLSRSLLDFASLLERAHREGWSFASLDLGVDTTTPTGRFVAHLMANVAQLEREMIAERTREALRSKQRQGVRLGRAPAVPHAVVSRIVDEHRSGRSLRAIAAGLESDGVPTVLGSAWRHSSVQRVIASSSTCPRIQPATALPTSNVSMEVPPD